MSKPMKVAITILVSLLIFLVGFFCGIGLIGDAIINNNLCENILEVK